MRWVRSFDLFLFDFDGLLVDTERLHFEAYGEMCRRHGLVLPWSFDDYVGIAHTSAQGIRQAISTLFGRELDWDALYVEKQRIYRNRLESGSLQLHEGVAVLLELLLLLGKKRCVVTHSPLASVEIIKRSIPLLETIPLWFTRETYRDPKPAPDGYIAAMKRLKTEGDRVIGFEDSLRGYESLTRAGVDTPILVCSRSHPQLRHLQEGEVRHASSVLDVGRLLGI